MGAALLPVVAVAAFALVALAQRLGRFDERYFDLNDRDAYSGPGAALLGLQDALRTGDDAAQAELQGRDDPHRFAAVPDAVLDGFLANGPHYVTYALFSPASQQRIVVNFEQVGGRWVFAPRDAYFYLRSGLWVPHAIRLTAASWLAAMLLAATQFWFAARARDSAVSGTTARAS